MSASSGSGPMSAPSGPAPATGPMSAPSGPAPATGPTSAPSGPAPATGPTSAPATGPTAFASPYPVTGSAAPSQPMAPAMSVPSAGGSAPARTEAAPSSGAAYSAPSTGNLNDYFSGNAAPAPDAQPTGLSAAPSDSVLAGEPEDAAPPGGTFGSWMLTILLVGLPLIGIIYLFVLSFGGSSPAWRRNWARAMLAWMAIAFVLAGITVVVAGQALYQMVGG